MLTTKIVLILNLMDSKKNNNEMKFEYDFKEHNGGQT